MNVLQSLISRVRGPWASWRQYDNPGHTSNAALAEIPAQPRDLPAGGRSSEDPSRSALDVLLGILGEVDPLVPWPLLDKIETLSITNPDLFQAVGNIVLLGNSGHTVELEADDANQARFQDLLDAWGLDAYPFGGGVEGLVNDLFGQLARYGALSMEWVANENLDDLLKGVLVPVRSVRFRLSDQPGGGYEPWQKTGYLKEDLIPLNPWTYVYLAAERLDRSPYAIPPVLAALRHVAIQEDMVTQLAAIAKKVGLFGFVQILLSAPQQREKESDEAYKARCRSYLDQTMASVREAGTFKDGVAVGFKDVQEFSVTPSTANPAGVQGLIEVNETLLASGLRQDPAMFGRTYSTTETYATVVLEKTMAMLANYQRLVGMSLERGYKLKAWLNGVRFQRLKVVWKPSALVNQKLAQEVYQLEILNADNLYNQGVISQEERARILGYTEPDQEEPRQSAQAAPGGFPAGLKAVREAAALAKADPAFHALLGKVLETYTTDPEGTAKAVAEARRLHLAAKKKGT